MELRKVLESRRGAGRARRRRAAWRTRAAAACRCRCAWSRASSPTTTRSCRRSPSASPSVDAADAARGAAPRLGGVERAHARREAAARQQRLELSTINPDVGEAAEEIEVEYDGEPMSIGFNARYLIDVLGVLPADKRIEIGLNDEVSPGVMRTAGRCRLLLYRDADAALIDGPRRRCADRLAAASTEPPRRARTKRKSLILQRFIYRIPALP